MAAKIDTAAARKIGAGTWAVPSRSRAGVEQVVKLVAGTMSCSCEWSFWHTSDCHHIKCVLALLMVESLAPKSDADAKRRDLGLFLITGGRQGSAA
jgi:hypothetical protein